MLQIAQFCRFSRPSCNQRVSNAFARVALFVLLATAFDSSTAFARSPYLNPPAKLQSGYDEYLAAKGELQQRQLEHDRTKSTQSAALKRLNAYMEAYFAALENARTKVVNIKQQLQKSNAALTEIRRAKTTPDPEIEKLKNEIDALSAATGGSVQSQLRALNVRLNKLEREAFDKRQKLAAQEAELVGTISILEAELISANREFVSLGGKAHSVYSFKKEEELRFQLREATTAETRAATLVEAAYKAYYDKVLKYVEIYAANPPRYLQRVEIQVDRRPHYRAQYTPKIKSQIVDSELQAKIERAKRQLPEIFATISELSRLRARVTSRILTLHRELQEDLKSNYAALDRAVVGPTIVEISFTIMEAIATGGAATTWEAVGQGGIAAAGKGGSYLLTSRSDTLKNVFGEESASQSVTGDSLEFVISSSSQFAVLPNHYKTVLLDAWSKYRGKPVPVVKGMTPGTLTDMFSPSGVGFSILGALAKAAVADIFAGELNIVSARLLATRIELQSLTHTLQLERALFVALEKMRADYENTIADYIQRQTLSQLDVDFELVRELDEQWLFANQVRKEATIINVEVRFSAPLTQAPEIRLHGNPARKISRNNRNPDGSSWISEFEIGREDLYDVERMVLDVSLSQDESPFTALDSSPETLALPKPIKQDWDKYEPGSDRNHGLLVGTPIPDLNGRWIAISPVGNDVLSGAYLFRVVQSDFKEGRVASAIPALSERKKRFEKVNLTMSVDYVPERLSFLCRLFPHPRRSCVNVGSILLETELGESERGLAYIGTARLYQTDLGHPDYKAAIPVTVLFDEVGSRLDVVLNGSEKTNLGGEFGNQIVVTFKRRGLSDAEKLLLENSETGNPFGYFYSIGAIAPEFDVRTGEELSPGFPAAFGTGGNVVPTAEVGQEDGWTPPMLSPVERDWITENADRIVDVAGNAGTKENSSGPVIKPFNPVAPLIPNDFLDTPSPQPASPSGG